jgi:hypothetical protein
MGKDAHFLCLFGDYKSLKSTAAAAGAGCGGGGGITGDQSGVLRAASGLLFATLTCQECQ